jgi:hypothetical protein
VLVSFYRLFYVSVALFCAPYVFKLAAVIIWSGSVALRRGEAIQLLQEILTVCAPHILISSVSLVEPRLQRNGSRGYQLQIGATYDDACLSSLMPLLAKKGLSVKESNGHLIVYGH